MSGQELTLHNGCMRTSADQRGPGVQLLRALPVAAGLLLLTVVSLPGGPVPTLALLWFVPMFGCYLLAVDRWHQPDARMALSTAGITLSLLGLALADSAATLVPALFTCGLFGIRLPPRWLALFAVPFATLLMFALNNYRTPDRTDLLGAVGYLVLMAGGAAFRLVRVRGVALGEANDRLETLNAQLARQADLVAELARLQERERLARDLHDTLGHALSTLSVQVEAARRLISPDPGTADGLLTDARMLARTAMQDLRATLDDLREEGGPVTLSAMLHEVATPVARRAGWTLDIHLDEGAGRSLPPQLIHALRPVVAEALHNAARHAQAQRVQLVVTHTEDEMQVVVQDDGVGPPAEMSRSGHYGVQGMHERLRALDGNLAVSGGPLGGTQVTARVPLAVTVQERV